MTDLNPGKNDFLEQLTSVLEDHLSNEHFGVSELAGEMNMSRSNLLRKIKNLTKLSASQWIGQIRLKKGMELLRQSALTVSEVSYQVGFGSTSYFIKCFREYYGYPPGEVGKRSETKEPIISDANKPITGRRPVVIGLILLSMAILTVLVYFFVPHLSPPKPVEKSIAVLPFKDDSNDTTNIYLINGLMESTLSNLQKIKDLRVISRTSTEKYRNTTKSIPEMARELNVNYFVEGSGQKLGDQILLNIQLIDANNDHHLWAGQYRREAKDIFELQQEVSQKIAMEIQAIITAEERQQIEKIPTKNLQAYDLYLKGRDLSYIYAYGSTPEMEQANALFRQAIALDKEFAQAYAAAALNYYYLDMFQVHATYHDSLGIYADKAILYDPNLTEGMLAKALFYIQSKEYPDALPFLEKALEFSPNSAVVIGLLTDFYSFYIPNTSRYLEYALMGVRLDAAGQDSINLSYNYLRLGNGLLMTGFIDEALKYVDISLDYNPENPFSNYLRAYIVFAKDGDKAKARESLIRELSKDTTRLDIMQDVGKMCYFMKDYDSAYYYYKRFIEMREARHLDIYRHESLTMAKVLVANGMKEESEKFVQDFKDYAENDQSIYRHLQLASYYCYVGDSVRALKNVKLFTKEDNFQYWVLFTDLEPDMKKQMKNPEFKAAIGQIKAKFWATHDRIQETLEDKGLL